MGRLVISQNLTRNFLSSRNDKVNIIYLVFLESQGFHRRIIKTVYSVIFLKLKCLNNIIKLGLDG
jgi:hypothetical protein